MARRRRGPAAAALVAAVTAIALVLTPAGAGVAGAARTGDLPRGDPGVAAVVATYQTRIPALMREQHIPGLAVVVVDGDHVIWQQGFGWTDTDHKTPVTTDTIFNVESTSKVFTATAVMAAVQAGRLDLDVPITTYLPHFTVHSAFESHPERKITLRMLLGHTAGFTHEAPLANNYEPGSGTFDAHVRTISDTWLRFPVGVGYAYSNLGIDLAAYILEQVYGEPFPAVAHDLLLAPLGMDRSTYDRAQVRASTDRAVGNSDSIAAEPIDIPMMPSGGLWTSAGDLAKFLEMQLGDGTLDGRTILDSAHMTQMRTVPAPRAGAPAGYALGVARTRWQDAKNIDLFGHGGGGFGFLADLSWLPQLQLGIAVLTNSDTHDLQSALPLGILRDLIGSVATEYPARLAALPTQDPVVDPDDHWVPPGDLAQQIAARALPSSSAQSHRWDGYIGDYRTGGFGAMSPDYPTSRFVVTSGVPYFDAAEDGSRVRYRLTEVRPGVFLAGNGETLDLARASPLWRGIHLHRVTGGPLAWQWALLGLAALAAACWLVGGAIGSVRRLLGSRRAHRTGAPRPAAPAATARGRPYRWGRPVLGALGAVAVLVTAATVTVLPGLVDVGFLGHLDVALPVRLALHLPLAVVLLAGAFTVLLGVEAVGHPEQPRIRPRDAALALALAAVAIQLVAWNAVGWGF